MSVTLSQLKRIWEWTKDLFEVFKRCRFSIIMLGLVVLFFLGTEPGEDLLRSLGQSEEEASYCRIVFFGALCFLAVHAWYWARVILRFDGKGDQDSARRKRRSQMHKHIPRILGTLAFAAVGVGFYSSSDAYAQGDERAALYRLAIFCFALAGAFYAVTAFRRSIIDKIDVKKRGRTTDDHFSSSLSHPKDLGKSTVISLAASLSIAAFLFLLFWLSPLSAVHFGTGGIVLLAASSWIAFGTVLVRLGEIKKIPIITPLFCMLLLFSFVNDNHAIRTVPGTVPEKLTVQQDFQQWITERQGRWPKGGKQPVFVVATEGGGIRAAYWTGLVLGALQDSNPEFADHVYAISGVSGGSLGAAVFTALVNEQQQGRLGGSSLRIRADSILSADFLAPTAAYMLYPDLVQRFLFFPVPAFDRSIAIETAWEKRWADTMKSNTLSNGFHTLTAQRKRTLPALFLNSTRVESGKRVIASNLKIDQTFTDAVDLFGTMKAETRLSTAAHNSARFTYVSPAGTVKTPEGTWGHVVDGGYFDNSGAATAFEILDAISDNKEAWSQIVPVVIMITNDPLLSASDHAKPERFMNELLSPVRTFFNTRPARASYSRSALDLWTIEQEGIFLSLGLEDVKGPLPMSWVLSNLAKNSMQAHVDKMMSLPNGKHIDPLNPDHLSVLKRRLKEYAPIVEVE